METVSVTIEDMGGKKFKASLPNEIPISRLLPQLITRMGLSQTNATGRRVSYRLLHVESGVQLRDNETLKQANVQPNHTLKLFADLVAGQSWVFPAKSSSDDDYLHSHSRGDLS
jgi:hypothetical protein